MASIATTLKGFGRTILASLILIAATPHARAQPAAFEKAAADFQSLPTSLRYEVQRLLIAAGYSEAVSTTAFTPYTFEATKKFQTENGFAPTGSLSLDEFGTLKELATPVLSKWGLSPITHPDNELRLWIPRGLRLIETKESNGLSFRTPDNGLMILFLRLGSDSVSDGYTDMKKMLVSRGYPLDYNILSSDFFVISTTNGQVESYMRFRPAPGGLTGFWVLWKADSPYYPKRLVTLMSDLFRPSTAGARPPTPSP